MKASYIFTTNCIVLLVTKMFLKTPAYLILMLWL